jgi:hypothetical protein
MNIRTVLHSPSRAVAVVALIPDVDGALRAIVAGMVTGVGE